MKFYKKIKDFLIENYFDEKLSNDAKKHSKKWNGINVTWYGDKKQMIVVKASDIEEMEGNIFYEDKLNQAIELIQNAEENVEFECSYAILYKVSITNIIEEQQAFYDDRFEIDYSYKEYPFSIGNEELDLYLGNEFYFEEKYTISNEALEFFNKNKLALSNNISKLDLKNRFDNLEYEDENKIAFEDFINLEELIVESIKNNKGDIGRFIIQLRDGHHRIKAAISTGERYVCVLI